MRKSLAAPLALAAAISLMVPAVAAQTPSTDGDDKVTGRAYVRHDGGTDKGIEHCNAGGTNPTPDTNAADGDADANDGGNRRQGNEPYSVVDPTDPGSSTNPATVVAGWNDYCLSDLGAGWQGFAYSIDNGETWTDSIVPGYPQDTSPEGRASPLFGKHTDAGDPIAAFDRAGNLFVGGIAFNRAGPINGDVYVATYSTTPHASGYPYDYLRTRIVGRGTPSRNFQGIFQDKPMLEVDRTGGAHDGNVYVCWSRFTGFGQNSLYFSRSTNSGATFSRPVRISGNHSVQGCDIAVEGDGDVYVTWRTFDDNSSKTTNGLAFARSTNGGASFSNDRLIRAIVPYNPFDSSRDCGDGLEHCPADFVFHRVPLEPRVTADQTGELGGVYLVYNEIRPSSRVASTSSYSSAGGGRVGQSLVYVVRTTNNGQTWSAPAAVDPAAAGHQFFPDIDALAGRLGVVWQDNRTDPAYSVQRPIGNMKDAQGRAISPPGMDEVNTFFAGSANGTSYQSSLKVSSVGHQSQYEMFGSRQVPFHGDYNWLSFAERADGTLFGYMTRTDNRDVVPGEDPRETEEQGGFVDGFDVLQCRIDLGANEASGDGPLARRDAPYSGDNCGNAGGLDQNIYGNSVVFE
ncbi:MAG: hypothetical protein ACR2JZ_00250 [Candidatus Limnocylindrales bacterium]